MSTAARRIAFRFGLTGRRWGDTGPVVLLLHGRESAPRRFDELLEPLLASGRQVIELDDPSDVEASNDARVAEYAAAISEASETTIIRKNSSVLTPIVSGLPTAGGLAGYLMPGTRTTATKAAMAMTAEVPRAERLLKRPCTKAKASEKSPPTAML